jgi:hypothetical protein
LEKELTTHHKLQCFIKYYTGAQTCMDSLEQPRHWKMDRRFGRPGLGWEDIRLVLRKLGGEVSTGCIWLRLGTIGRLL